MAPSATCIVFRAERSGNRLIGCDLANPDFVAFARSFGAAAFRADTPPALEQALREAFALNSPALVHVKVGEMPKSLGHDPAAARPRLRRGGAAAFAMKRAAPARTKSGGDSGWVKLTFPHPPFLHEPVDPLTRCDLGWFPAFQQGIVETIN